MKMPWKISGLYLIHIKKNPKIYIFLFIVFVLGIVAGSFAVNNCYMQQREQLTNYIKYFMKIFDVKSIDNFLLFKVSLVREYKIIIILCFMGISVVGIPFIIGTVFFRGFVLGYTFTMIIDVLGSDGIITVFSIFFLKEIFLVTILLAVGVNGINFSTKISKMDFKKKLRLTSIKEKTAIYLIFTLIQLVVAIIPIFLEAIFLPVFIKL
jgi:stage II sporulation protein M